MTHDHESCSACQPERLRHRPLQAMRAYRLLDFLKSHPGKHHQGSWFEVGLAGLGYDTFDEYVTHAEVDPDGHDERRERYYGKADVIDSCGTVACAAGWTLLLDGYKINDKRNALTTDGREVYSIRDEARRLLGLSWDEADDLFSGANTLADVERIIYEIYGPDPRPVTG